MFAGVVTHVLFLFFWSRTKTPHQMIREHIDMFGFMQKNVNAMDILIEDAKVTLQTWGSLDPSFMLANSKLTFQMTMTPEKTNFITQGMSLLRFPCFSAYFSDCFSVHVYVQDTTVSRG